MQKFTGLEYLMIDVANSFGLDQETWANRLQWFNDYRVGLETDSLPNIVKWSKDAKEPAQFLAGVMAYRDTKAGKPTGYLCGLDATASGLQLLSVLSGCKQSAATCNLVDTGRREDAYTLVYQRVCEILNVHPSLFAIPRKDCKQALMTHLYGSKAVPKQVFGEDTPQLAAFYQAIDELMPGANELNHGLLGLWNPDALTHSWVLPDGFEAEIKVMDKDKHVVDFLGKKFEIIERVNRPKEQGLSLGANIVHSLDGMVVREMGRRCTYNAKKIAEVDAMLGLAGGHSMTRKDDLSLLRLLALFDGTGFMSLRIVDHLDLKNLGHMDSQARHVLQNIVNQLPEKSFDLVCIHDCFKFHANYGNDVRLQYTRILAELADCNVLDYIVAALTGKYGVVQKLSHTLDNDILQSEYAIC